jgi:predicted amino acid dehydrogenase/ribosome-associated toxin RatA of RatAB toxin-antitoxin module
MPDNDPIEIKVSRVISAEKWKIIRLLTKVEDFPSFVPTVKEASVIQKSRNKITTKWHIQVDSVPIQWIEEDILDLEHGTIRFKAIEGDLSEFEGTWTFKGCPEGNEVTVCVRMRVDIPAIKSFAEPYISKMLVRNFEAILDAFEQRLVSSRYLSYKKGGVEKIAGFGIIGHLYNFYHLEKSLKMLKPDFAMPSKEFLGQLFHVTPSFKLYDILNFKSKTGETVNGCFIVATFIPEMVENDVWAVFSKVVKACKIAEKHGIGIVTLGGFTSIVAERTGHEIASEVNVPVTTGNSFTAAMAIDGVLKAAELVNLDLAKARSTIIGGTGDIGSACAKVLAEKVRELTITGRTKANLARIRNELAKKRKAKIFATTDNIDAAKTADIVIAAASSVTSILKVDHFKPGAIICDVAYPKNISYTHTDRQDIFIFSGGLAKSPTPLAIPFDIGLPSPDTIYGCFSESIILALEKRYENFSFGRGNITPEKIEEIRQLGKKHGFEVADFYWGDKLIDAPIIENVKRIIHENKTDCAG